MREHEEIFVDVVSFLWFLLTFFFLNFILKECLERKAKEGQDLKDHEVCQDHLVNISCSIRL